MILQDEEDSLTNILCRVPSGATWVAYDKSLPRGSYETAHYDQPSDILILRLTKEKDTYTKVTQLQYFKDLLSVQVAFVANLRTVHGLPDDIDPDRPPKNFKDAMSRPDSQEWAEAYQKEFQGCKDRNVFAVVKPPPGTKVLGTTTRTEYKINNGVMEKRKVRMCIRGDQQTEGVNFDSSDLYSPVLKATEARLLAAIAAEHGCPILKTDTRQAFLYGEMGDDKVYVRPPDWWPEPVPEGHVFLLLKSMYGTKQAARRWHLCISEWMEKNGYLAVNSEKTIFMKWDGDNFIIHGLFVDDMMHISTCDKLKQEFMAKYSKDFDITGGGLMETFLGMQVEQSENEIRLHLDNYIRETLDEYNAQLARFCASAGPSHWAALHHLMEYLEGKPSFKLTYRKRSALSNGLSGYCDSDWANSVSRRSTTGNVFLYNRAPISWKSKLQKTIALSTAEAEYYSASTAAVEVIYLRYLLKSMKFAQPTWTPVYEDNNACIEWSNNIIGGRERAKHIDIRKHFAHEAVRNGHLRLVRVDTSDQLAHVFTKGLHPGPMEECLSSILGGKRVAS